MFFAFFSCKKSKNEKPAQGHDIYIAGEDNDQPVYWKNGAKTTLPIYSADELSPGDATGITFLGDDMYICGVSGGRVVYWKNGMLDTLQVIPGFPARASSIIAYGKDIYIGGGYNGYLVPTIQNGAILWKNGSPTKFGGSVARISNLFATTNDLYSVGPDGNNATDTYATYYKNGAVVKLTDSAGFASTGIYVSGNDVYVSGNKISGFDTYAVYWKNGIKNSLSNQNSGTNTVYLSGGNIYVAGWELLNGKSVATVWKNGVAIHLSSAQSNCTDIIVSGNDVFAIGVVAIPENLLYAAATMWKNGVATTLLPTASFANKVYIK
jgi:hypothetical protein